MAKYPAKPQIPSFRASAPGATDCKTCYPFTGCFRGRVTVPNIVANSNAGSGTLTNNIVWSRGSVGDCVECTDTAGSYVNLGDSQDVLVDASEQTFVCMHQRLWSSGNYYAFASPGWGDPYVNFQVNSSGALTCYWASANYVTATGSEYGIFNLYVVTIGPRGMEIWVDGSRAGFDGAMPTTVPITLDTNDFHIFGDDPKASQESKIGYFASYSRQLTVAEINDIYSDPWCMIRPPKLSIIDLSFGYGDFASNEKRQIDDMDAESSGTVTNESNAFTEDDNYASSASLAINAYVGGTFQDPTETPVDFIDFRIRFFDINADHVDDTYDLEFYDHDTTSWITVTTYNSGNLLPTALTTVDMDSVALSYYTAASNKSTWLTNLKWRIICSAKSAGNDNPEIGVAYAFYQYTYTAATVVDVAPISFSFSAKTPVASGAITNSVSPITFTKTVKAPVASGAITNGVSPVTFELSTQTPAATGAGSPSVSPTTFSFATQSPVGSGAGSASVAPTSFNFAAKTPVASSGFIVSVLPISFTFSPQAPVGSGAGSPSVSPTTFSLSPQTPVGSGDISVSASPISFSIVSRTPAGSGAGAPTVSPISYVLSARSSAGSGVGTVSVAPTSFSLSVLAPLADAGGGIVYVDPITFQFLLQSPIGSGAGSATVAPTSFSLSAVTPAGSGDGIVSVSPVPFEILTRTPVGSGDGVVSVSPITWTFVPLDPAIVGQYVEIPDSVREITAVSGKNQIIIITGPIALTVGDEIRIVGKVSTYDTSSEWLADESTISLIKV